MIGGGGMFGLKTKEKIAENAEVLEKIGKQGKKQQKNVRTTLVQAYKKGESHG